MPPKKPAAKKLKPEPKPLSINEEANTIINGERRDDYGPAKDSFDRIAQGWSVLFGVPVNAHQVSLAMIWLKSVRALNGFQRDSFVDICGYAGLAEVISGDD
jgi:hypothetical protein